MSRGFLTVAQNSIMGDYVRHAMALAHSLRITQRGPCGLSVCVPEGTEVPEGVFEHVVYSDPAGTDETKWNAHTKARAMAASPYDETILVDADMLFPVDVSWWWDLLVKYDLIFASQPMTFRGAEVDEKNNIYRKEFRANDLPNVYSALMYFRPTRRVREFIDYSLWMTENWEAYRDATMEHVTNWQPTDDMTFASACRDLGLDRDSILNGSNWFTFVHMKSQIQNLDTHAILAEDWTRYMNWQVKPDGSLTVGHYHQRFPFHYHDRSFLTENVMQTLESASV